MNRYEPTTTHLAGVRTRVVDGPSFASAYEAIFVREIYRFPARAPDPLILDCGANVGLAVLYWKTIYPAARIIAFEPDASVFAALEQNLAASGLADVNAVRAAVWTEDGELSFWSEGADAGRLAAGGEGHTRVRAVRLRDELDKPVDLLKLDIEGAEVDVIVDCADQLTNVARLFVEYHSLVGHEQRLDELLAALRPAGFRYFLEPEYPSGQPFMLRDVHVGMDNQVNIYAFR